MPSIGEGSVK